jgi:hypothetical protein
MLVFGSESSPVAGHCRRSDELLGWKQASKPAIFVFIWVTNIFFKKDSHQIIQNVMQHVLRAIANDEGIQLALSNHLALRPWTHSWHWSYCIPGRNRNRTLNQNCSSWRRRTWHLIQTSKPRICHVVYGPGTVDRQADRRRICGLEEESTE